MTTKHTPGPWVACGYWVEHPDHRQNDICNCDPASMQQQGRSDAEIRANTVMISAAPDMLQVLQELEESAAYWSEYDVPVGIVERIRAAIAKATGDAG